MYLKTYRRRDAGNAVSFYGVIVLYIDRILLLLLLLLITSPSLFLVRSEITAIFTRINVLVRVMIKVKVKVNVKVLPITGHEGPEGD